MNTRSLVSLSGWRQTYLWGWYTSGLERYEGVDFHQKSLMIGVGSEPLSWLGERSGITSGRDLLRHQPLSPASNGPGDEADLEAISSLNVSYSRETTAS